MMVLDFTQAVWQIAIWPGERKYFTTKVAHAYYVYLRVAQGSRAGKWSHFLAQPTFQSRQGRLGRLHVPVMSHLST
eukprot:4681745-Amphidinium_carterae.4